MYKLRSNYRWLVLILALVSAPLAWAGGFSGKVVAVTDGDTIQVMHDGRAEKIRLNGVDCPESHQAFGQRAKQFASDMVFGKTVTVEVKEKDKYGRTVGDVTLEDGRSLNRELVRAGFAWWYRQYSHDQSLGDLETEARNAKRGLWADLTPIAPWDFRHGKKTATQEAVSSPVARRPGDSLSERLPPGSGTPSRPTGEGLSPGALQARQADTGLSERLGGGGTSVRTAPPVQQDPQSEIVHITRTGKKYHREGCRYLSKSDIPVSLSDAKARGLGRCSVCVPPQ